MSLGKDKFVFDNIGEPLIPDIIRRIHKVLKYVPEVDFKNVYHTTASIDGAEKYEGICKEYNLQGRMNILACNFYERLAAQDNYRLKQEIQYEIGIRPKKFLCLNKVHRYHRVRLVAYLLANDLVDTSLVSFYGSQFDNSWINVFNQFWPEYTTEPHIVWEAINKNRSRFPMVLNAGLDRNNPIQIEESDVELYKQTYYSIVPETMFFKKSHRFHNLHNFADSHFISEKTYKEITAKQPFIVMGWPGTMKHLKSLGYKTFHPYINEAYDEETDDVKRFDMIIEEVIRLDSLTDEQWLEWQSHIKEIVDYNYNLIKSKTDFAITHGFTKDWS